MSPDNAWRENNIFRHRGNENVELRTFHEGITLYWQIESIYLYRFIMGHDGSYYTVCINLMKKM